MPGTNEQLSGGGLALDLHEGQANVLEGALHRGCFGPETIAEPVDQAGECIDRECGLSRSGSSADRWIAANS